MCAARLGIRNSKNQATSVFLNWKFFPGFLRSWCAEQMFYVFLLVVLVLMAEIFDAAAETAAVEAAVVKVVSVQ